jgi:uncharacterized damage-inducible protein DinB
MTEKGPTAAELAAMFRRDVHANIDQHLPKIIRCLQLMTEKEIWWRPNAASNSAGNIVLHLCGNIRQWIISGIGGAPDLRERDREFSERGPIARRVLIARLKETTAEACAIIDNVSAQTLARKFHIQGYHGSGLAALAHVSEHFSYHAGQVIYLAKLKGGRDLRFTRLPKMPRAQKTGTG